MMLDRRLSLASNLFHTDCGPEFAKFVNNPHLHDITILCGSSTFYAHSDILRSRCAALDDRLRQSSNPVLEIDADPAVVFLLLKFIYTAKIPEADSPEQVPELIRVARHLHLKDLVINLMLRFNRSAQDCDSAERNETERERYDGEGESDGSDPCFSYNTTELNTQVFFDAARLEGKVAVNVGQYKFRRQSAVLLAARSTWFNERIDSLECTVDASCIPVNQVARALRFIRIEGVDGLRSASDSFDALFWSWKLGVQPMQSWVEHVIVTKFIDKHNVCQIWSSPACSEYLAERCMSFLQENFVDCASSIGFLTLRQELVKKALSAGRIDADFTIILAALRRWIERNASRPGEREQVLLEFLPPNTIFNLTNRMALLGVDHHHPLSCAV